jgi:hypothetical protein
LHVLISGAFSCIIKVIPNGKDLPMSTSRWDVLDREFPDWRLAFECRTLAEWIHDYKLVTDNPSDFTAFMALNTASHRLAQESVNGGHGVAFSWREKPRY